MFYKTNVKEKKKNSYELNDKFWVNSHKISYFIHIPRTQLELIFNALLTYFKQVIKSPISYKT